MRRLRGAVVKPRVHTVVLSLGRSQRRDVDSV